MAIQPHTKEVASGNTFTLYGETVNINWFVFDELEPAADGSVENRQASVKAHSRRQYPGDLTPSNVNATTRSYMYDPTKKVGRGLPGKSITLQAYNEDGEPTERRTFTLKGRLIDFRAWFDANAKYVTKVYTSAAKYIVKPLEL